MKNLVLLCVVILLAPITGEAQQPAKAKQLHPHPDLMRCKQVLNDLGPELIPSSLAEANKAGLWAFASDCPRYVVYFHANDFTRKETLRLLKLLAASQHHLQEELDKERKSYDKLDKVLGESLKSWSAVDEEYNKLVAKYNKLVNDYNSLLEVSQRLVGEIVSQEIASQKLKLLLLQQSLWLPLSCTSQRVGSFTYTSCY